MRSFWWFWFCIVINIITYRYGSVCIQTRGQDLTILFWIRTRELMWFFSTWSSRSCNLFRLTIVHIQEFQSDLFMYKHTFSKREMFIYTSDWMNERSRNGKEKKMNEWDRWFSLNSILNGPTEIVKSNELFLKDELRMRYSSCRWFHSLLQPKHHDWSVSLILVFYDDFDELHQHVNTALFSSLNDGIDEIHWSYFCFSLGNIFSRTIVMIKK